MKFSEMNLLPEMLRAIEEQGFETLTDIQAEAIPIVREGRDIIGKSQTGTGKTLAFAIPAIEKI
ncbi:MAG: DEAD/DEAH box helicase, partial [Clostridia bacterium]|nr:DEAD/DEAH box helicase [Clostridia bacterium]